MPGEGRESCDTGCSAPESSSSDFEALVQVAFRAFVLSVAALSAVVARAQDCACVTLRDDATHRAIASALVRIDVPGSAAQAARSRAARR